MQFLYILNHKKSFIFNKNDQNNNLVCHKVQLFEYSNKQNKSFLASTKLVFQMNY